MCMWTCRYYACVLLCGGLALSCSSHAPDLHLQVVINKEACTIVGDGSSQADVSARVKQIRNLAEQTEQEYEKEKLNERIARLSGGVAIIQVWVQAT